MAEVKASNRCAWCSAETTADSTICRSCGAVLAETSPASPEPTESAIPGVTAVMPSAELRTPASRKRRSIFSLLTGAPDPEFEVPIGVGPVDESAIQPPSPEVRREMLRIELEAHGYVFAGSDATQPE